MTQKIEKLAQSEFDSTSEWPWYRLVTPREAAKLPRGWRNKSIGHVYIAILSNATIKIGATRAPSQRAAQHIGAVRKFTDLDIDAFYFTAPHTNYLQNEMKIHTGLPRPGSDRGRAAEVYKTLSLQDAIALVHSCRFVVER